MDLRGRTIVITGASRGLGAGMAEAFRAAGARLGLCARSAVPLAGQPGVVAEAVDVRDGAAVERFAAAVADALGPIDLWINNAGVLEPIRPLRDLAADDLRAHLEINVLGVFSGTHTYIRHVRQRGGEGVLVNISSGAAQKGYAGWGAYCAGKAAVDRLTECAQLEEGSRLRAYAVAPGIIDTDMQALIRRCTPEQFPQVERFREFKRADAFNSPAYVARCVAEIAFDPGKRPAGVVVRLPEEPR